MSEADRWEMRAGFQLVIANICFMRNMLFAGTVFTVLCVIATVIHFKESK